MRSVSPIDPSFKALKTALDGAQKVNTKLRPARKLVNGLDQGLPVALLPVRLETRFFERDALGPARLCVRIYPDTIHGAAKLSTLLPDAWLAYGYGSHQPRGNRSPFTLIGASAAVRTDLVLESLDDQGRPVADLGTSKHTNWLVDYAEAEAAGMAITLPLTTETIGAELNSLAHVVIDQLVVVGVSAGKDFDATLSNLLQGWVTSESGPRAGLVAPGTPTNVVEGSKNAVGTGLTKSKLLGPGDRPKSEVVGGADTDGALLAQALGIKHELLALGGASRREQAGEASINALLWGATVMALREEIPELKEATQNPGVLEALRKHIVGYLRAQGPFPSMVVDDQPYGFLPVMAPRAPTRTPSTAQPDALVVHGVTAVSNALWPRWASAAKRVPALDVDASDSADDEAESVDTLASVLLRGPFPESLAIGLLAERNATAVARAARAGRLKASLTELRAALANFFPLPDYRAAAAACVDALPKDPAGRAVDELDAALVRTKDLVVAASSVSSRHVRAQAAALEDKVRDFEQILRSLPVGWLDLVDEVSDEPSSIRPIDVVKDHVIKDGPGQRWRYAVGTSDDDLKMLRSTLKLVAANLEAGRGAPDWSPKAEDSLFLYLLTPVVRGTLTDGARTDAVLALRLLAEADADDLNRWVAAGLDLFSTRLDAWITSLATRRLHTMRQAAPQGLHLGGYGVVLGLKARDKLVASAQLAPTVNHVLTNSVLHAAHQSYSENGIGASGAPSPFTVTLTSERVRRGQWLIDGVRQGQTLSDMLGELFEDELQRSNQADRIDEFRLVTRGTVRRRTDGLLLARHWRDGLHLDGLPTLAPDGPKEILLDALDCVYDVGLYESAHAFSLGNKERGAALLAALDCGDAPPPGSNALSTPEVGLTLRHRLMLSLPTTRGPTPRNSWSVSWLSSAMSPLVDAYVRQVLPAPTDLMATITWKNAAGEPVVGPHQLTLVGWDALQFLRDAVDPARLQGSPLARRLAARDAVDRWDTLRVANAVQATVSASDALADSLLLGLALRSALDGARAATQQSFTVSEEDADLLDATLPDAPDLDPVSEPSDLKARWKWLVELDCLGLNTAPPPAELPSEVTELPDDMLKALLESAKQCLGRLLQPANPEQVSAAVGWRMPRVQTPFTFAAADLHQPDEPPTASALGGWLSGLARVRAPAERADRFLRLCDIVNPTRSPKASVMQHDAVIPADGTGPWLGESAPQADPRRRDLLHVMMLGAPPEAGARFAALVLDAWTEQIPYTHRTVGVGLHWDAPTSRPPNVILLAVPPEGEGWSAELLAESVLRAVELAKVRLVDKSELEGLVEGGERKLVSGILLKNEKIVTGPPVPPGFLRASEALATLGGTNSEHLMQAAALADIVSHRSARRT